VRFAADPVATRLEVVADAKRMGKHDAMRVMVRALDQVGNKLPFYPEPVSITVTGAARRIGPGFVPLRAGSTGFWLQAQGKGDITVTVVSDRLGSQVLQLVAE
jgi:beta-galactosidase